MPVILGKSGVNKELKEIYLGNLGVNKKEKEIYQGKVGINRKIYTETLFELANIQIYDYLNNKPFPNTLYPNSIEFDYYVSSRSGTSASFIINFSKDFENIQILQLQLFSTLYPVNGIDDCYIDVWYMGYKLGTIYMGAAGDILGTNTMRIIFKPNILEIRSYSSLLGSYPISVLPEFNYYSFYKNNMGVTASNLVIK